MHTSVRQSRIERLEFRKLLSSVPLAGAAAEVVDALPGAALIRGIPTGETDWGDAPDSYGTTFAAGGPVHEVDFGDIRLGALIDIEANGIPSLNADGDDLDNFDDEDGVSISSALVPESVAQVTLRIGNRSGTARSE
ncbi:MAG: hypothetical protein AAGK78_10580, partial [Planctomycetota bacterium]